MKKIYLLTLIVAIFASCSTTSDVVSNKRIQKRKYTKGFNIKSQKKNNYRLALKDQSSSKLNAKVSSENNVNENTNLFLASREGVIIEQTIANHTLKTELKNLNRLLINEKKSNKIINVSDPVLLKKLKKDFKAISLDGKVVKPKVHWAALTCMICGILCLLVTHFFIRNTWKNIWWNCSN